MENFFPLNNDYLLEGRSDLFYPTAQMFMRTIQTSSFVDMLTCSDEVQPSTALASFRLDYEYEIEYEYDFRISNQ